MKKIQHIFNYIFYMAYKKEEKRWAASPVLSGILELSLVVNLLIFIIILVTEMVFNINIISGKDAQNILIPLALTISIIVAIINYFIYGYKKKYLKIIEKYKNEDKNMRKKNRRTATLFIIFSLILAVVIAIIAIQLG